MTQTASPSRAANLGPASEAEARVRAEVERYHDFAADVALVTYDPEERPLFAGPNGRAKTAVMLLSTALYESGFRRDVDLGIGPRARGDGGRSCTAFQFNLGDKGKTREGWTCQDMYADRTLAVRAALTHLRSAMGACRSLPVEDRLSMYTHGQCVAGDAHARKRYGTFASWVARFPAPMMDEAAAKKALEESESDQNRN
jgi:hypothetical protein